MQAVLAQNWRALAATGALAVGYLGACSAVGRARLLPPRLARKLTHIGTGPLYMLCWQMFSGDPAARWLAASVPAAAGLAFWAVGSGRLRFDALVASSSRTGRAEELLRGPLYYAAVHVAVTLMLWRSPAAVLALSALCGGDGLAEVAGRSASGAAATRLPHNPAKTLAGSLACWLGGAATAAPLLLAFRRTSTFDAAALAAARVPLAGWPLAAGVLLACGVGAVVESLPIGAELDNFTVPAAVALASRAWFGC